MNNPFEPPQKPTSAQGPVHPLERGPLPPPQRPPAPAIPTRQVIVQQSQPILAYGILGLNVIVFLADLMLGGQLTYLGAKENTAILAGELWRFATPMFLHAGWLHLGVNSYSLYIVGPQLERSYGHWRFLAIYLLSGIAGVIASFSFSPDAISVGASGAIFGLVGALLPMLYRNRTVMADTRGRMVAVIQVIAINLLIGLTSGLRIDNWGHIGGLAGGLALGWFATPLYKVLQDIDGSIRVKDESSDASAWVAALFLGALLGGVVYLEILLMGRQLMP